jgi:hypothetical protein
MTTRLAVLGAVLALAAGPNQAMAGYLTPAYEARLEGWLGEGNLTFTPIFEKVAGEGGYSIQSSYGPGYLSSNVFGRSFVGFPIAGIEVYSLAPAGPVSAVPTPPGLVLIATGAVPLLGRRLRRRKSPATA